MIIENKKNGTGYVLAFSLEGDILKGFKL